MTLHRALPNNTGLSNKAKVENLCTHLIIGTGWECPTNVQYLPVANANETYSSGRASRLDYYWPCGGILRRCSLCLWAFDIRRLGDCSCAYRVPRLPALLEKASILTGGTVRDSMGSQTVEQLLACAEALLATQDLIRTLQSFGQQTIPLLLAS